MINAYHISDAVPAAMISIFALWAIGSTWHWFLRTSVVAAALFLPLFIPAYEMVIQFGIQVLIVVCGLLVWRLRRNRAVGIGRSSHRSQAQLSLRDALLLTAVLAANLALLVNIPELTWYQWMVLAGGGAMSGLVTLWCAWLVLSDVRPAVRWAVACMLVPVLAFCITFVEIGRDTIYYLITYWSRARIWPYFQERIATETWTRSIYWFYVLTIAMPIVCAWLYLAVNAGWHSGMAGEAQLKAIAEYPHRRRLAWRALVALSLAIIVFPGYLFYRLVTPRPYSQDRSTMPAGFAELTVAGEMLGTAGAAKLEGHQQMSDGALAAELATREPALAVMRRAFALPFECTSRTIEEDSPAASYLFFMVEARLDLANRTNMLDQQLDASLDWLRLNDLLLRDDLDLLKYIFLQRDAVQTIWANREKISAQRTREVATAIWELDQRRIPWHRVEEHRKRTDENAGWQLHLQTMLDDWSGYDRLIGYRTVYLHTIAELRVLTCNLAVRAFRHEHRRLPLQLEELVPEYLPTIPGDPFNDKKLGYKLVDRVFTVYSVGPDLDDDGGKAFDATSNDGDITSLRLFP